MTDTTYYPYLGSGKIYARVAGIAAGLIYMGNASKLDITVKDKKVTLQDFSKPGDGVYASVSRIESATLNVTLNDLNKANIARAIFGTDSAITGASVVDEALVAYLDALVPLAHPNPTAVVVKDSATSAITYVAGTNYEVRAGGIYIPTGSAIVAAEALKVSYTFAAYSKVEAMTGGAPVLT
jgi:hypothetical protein